MNINRPLCMPELMKQKKIEKSTSSKKEKKFFYFAKSTRRHCFRASHHYQACSSYLISWLGSRAREVNKCRIVNKITCLTLSIHPAKPWPYHSYRLETIPVRIRREWPLFGFICKGWSIAPIVHDLRAIFQRPKSPRKRVYESESTKIFIHFIYQGKNNLC